MIEIIATSTMGLESVVARELQNLGYEPKNIEVGRTLFTGTERDICRANIHLRCAGHVLIRVGEFPCEDFGQLFDQTVELPWERWLPKNACFPVDGRSVRSTLSSVPAVQGVVKKAIVTRLQKAWKTETLPEDGPKYPVEISLLKDRATLTIDTTGEGLHRRGYRKLVGAAPLRETLAAGLVLLSYWNRERPLLDPFCGSGTIPIEAALIGRNIAPGLKRNFISETWNQIPFQDWVDVRLAAKEAILPDVPAPIFGCDLDPDAVEMSRYHAQMAGVSNDVRFECRDFLKTESSDEYGCTIMNPPYGKWIGEYSELKALYFAIPSILQKLPTWSHYIYTAFPDFERLIGQEASRRRKIYNSRLECTYYQFFGPRPPKETEPSEENSQPSSQPIRGVFGGLSDSVKNSAKDFERRLEKLNHHLRRWPTKRGITCFRVYDRDIPEIPLAIDRYEDCLHIAEYDRPNDRNAAQQGQWMDLMVEITGRVLDVPKEKIFVKRRQRQRGASQYERWDTRHFVIEAHEGGLKFFVNLSDYLDTGLFLDHRITREMVRKEAAGKRFLNLFAYTGSFSVYAAAGGAQSVTTVDLSNTYLDWAQDNMELNGFRGPQFEYVRSDVFRFLNALYDDEIFDLVVLDPPTFSNSKDLDDWDVQRDHAEMLNLLISHLAPGGVIYFSNNNRRFKLDEDAIQGVSIREISNRTVPEDFRNKRIHRCWRMVKKDE
ncbi:MAG: bifunctional 23S rRNA (guanine(2069)-N(7))-methyltransferase RlmK/23S rRNA (guanine(2445)-N(2))-methyltransferase RlmL [Thermoguttaceae bacterium]|nr:bifunctional 23S rRNA (guanine(2069)-N(7))-methyltransferase RlmK/23S rRNA (guanine(2445)-N(2))-methyltransferase RlmL [Thermoguttaceae bacterium]